MRVPGGLGDGAVGDDVEDEAAGHELVGDDGDEGHDQGHGPEEAGGGSVADLEHVADGVLAEGVDLGGQEVDQDDADPGAGGEPKGREPGLGRELGARDEGARADPGADQGEDHDLPLEAPAGDLEVVLAFNLAGAVEVESGQDDEIGENDDDVDGHVALLGMRREFPDTYLIPYLSPFQRLGDAAAGHRLAIIGIRYVSGNSGGRPASASDRPSP